MLSSAAQDAQPASLYDPAFEHDACGVGMICRLSGVPDRAVVTDALQILVNLDHRGGTGADPDSGDGAGLLVQIPDRFFRRVLPFDLPEVGRYAVGCVLLPKDASESAALVAHAEAAIARSGLRLLGWREVPVDSAHVGEVARAAEPKMRQVFVTSDDALDFEDDGIGFERRCYLARKRIEGRGWGVGSGEMERAQPASDRPSSGSPVEKKNARRHGGADRNLPIPNPSSPHREPRPPAPAPPALYITGLSARTLVYKGMLTTEQLGRYFRDLAEPDFESALALVHSRFSTNTLPEWRLAQPFRMLCHNGEINTAPGNRAWMKAREGQMRASRFAEAFEQAYAADFGELLPVIQPGGSDSMSLDNAAEWLRFSGRSLPHAMMMLVPTAWEHDASLTDAERAFFEYHAGLMEPWDGPATLPFTDGRYVGCVLDRNGLRPSRYAVTDDGTVVLSSETGAILLEPSSIVEKGRVAPGRMFLVDLKEGRIVRDREIKRAVAERQPYGAWLFAHQVHLAELEAEATDEVAPASLSADALLRQQQLHGYTREDLRHFLPPMGADGKESIGSMGDDTPLAVLSEKPRLLFDYARQRFAQVTNPPLDAIREALVTSLSTRLGPEGGLFGESAAHAARVALDGPVLMPAELARLRTSRLPFALETLDAVFPVDEGGAGLEAAVEALCREAERAVRAGVGIVVVSDRAADAQHAPIPALLATGAVHHHLVREGLRTSVGLVIETGEAREVHHFACLLGYGAGAVCPTVAFETVRSLSEGGWLGEVTPEKAARNYRKALGLGLLKVMSKMGISTIQSYRGAQIFEIVGIHPSVVARYFTGTPSRLGGVGLAQIAADAAQRHARAYGEQPAHGESLEEGGKTQWRRTGEHHTFGPHAVAELQQAVRTNSDATYAAFAARVNDQSRKLGTLRGLLGFADAEPIPLEDVEPWTEIVKRFKTGAMSYGSISGEAHEALAVAMNRLGGRSNTGEGGEAPARYQRGNPARSRIKQVASGRFGVTLGYLASADEIQIKMAQGAKPGEGGQLPGEKVYPWIAETRHATPWVGLISPPPHHDIYSIEDLAQLIHDLKCANPSARISVKLVAEAGVGTVAAGVAKAKAEVVLVSGHDGGTGAAAHTSLLHAGLPWELGLAETHQTLTRHGLRKRIAVEIDGQLRTGRDVAVAALLGAEEFGFATAPLVALGCIMMRKCHLNTCPVGIATQDPQLRALFRGEPEHVVNYLHFVAEELRGIMAQLGIRTIDEMVGRTDLLVQRDAPHAKAAALDLSLLLARPETPGALRGFDITTQDHGLEDKLDHALIAQARPALERGEVAEIHVPIHTGQRTTGTLLSGQIHARWGEAGLPAETITIRASGSAGQSFGAFGAPGLAMHVRGDANDYLGKGLSGALLTVAPPESSLFLAEENVVIGNVALYGATSGRLFARGLAGERFAVRNSGASAVVEGVGDHGCEYMTGGRVVVLGPAGRNFAAGMSGGIAYVLAPTEHFAYACLNREMVEADRMDPRDEDAEELRALVAEHAERTGSDVAARLLADWPSALPLIVRVIPTAYREAMEAARKERGAEAGGVAAVANAVAP